VAAPASPCTGVCKVNASGVCRGCGRTLDEIAQWPVASDRRRQVIVDTARQRRADMRRARKQP
jgi:uncharacterized protein